MAQTDLRFSFEPAHNASAQAGTEINFDVVEFKLTEALNEPFVLEVELLSADADIDFAKLLDQGALLTIWQGATAVRRVHGVVSHFSQGNSGFRRTRYHAVIEPMLSRTQLFSDWRIFQQKPVPEILTQVFNADHVTNFELQQQQTHLAREYCVQADETDFQYIQRLVAEEGFVYRFAHSEQGHQMILTDVIQTLGALEGSDGADGTVLYQPTPAGDQPQPALHTFSYHEQVRTARQTQRDYTFKNPRYNQHQASIGRDMPAQSSEYERYDYPGRYKQDAAGSPFTQTRLAALRRDAKLAIATGDDARIEPGVAFELTGHPRQNLNTVWRPVKVEHWGKQHTSAEEEAAGAQVSTSYTQTAELVPAAADWKAPLPAKPHLHGPEIAHVVGPQGEEIYCDEWGRVKVQFPWDRIGQNNEHSTCWIRVAQAWGIGGGDGQQSIPRIGQEVIVDFLDGDPDQPIITGRTNDALNPTPYELPKHKTRSTWRSHTHKGEGFNEIRFEDENQQEEIYVHAQKDQNIEVLNNETTWIGNDRSEHVEHNEKIFIGNDRSEQVINDEAVEIGHDRKHHVINDEFLNIDQNQTIEIGNNRVETIRNHRKDDIAANHWEKVGGHIEIQVEGHHQIEAGQQIIRKTQVYELGVQTQIVLKAPGGKITLDASGITLEGNINIKGPMNQVGSGGGEGISISGSPLATPFGECSEKSR
ncbi:type VI secretion system Vgr family protein [Saezia sanguinis]|uniref:type VI secretion system Vgr family protein n=1 Tax=Saezia sanguinis TaxID=1965230 RepID=UPI0030266AF0